MLYFMYCDYSQRLSMWFYALAEQYMGLLIFKTAHRLLFSNKLPVFLLQIYPDPELEQQILALPIRCIHSEEGCRWTGQMKQLQVRSFHICSNFSPYLCLLRICFILCCLIEHTRAPVANLPPPHLLFFWQQSGSTPNMWVDVCESNAFLLCYLP